MPASARIVIADDHPLVAEGMRALLVRDYDVTAVVHDARHIVEVVAARRPDLLLLDLSMPYVNGFQVLAQVRERFPCLRVLVVSMHGDRAFAELAFEKGAHGFLPKSESVAELRRAVAAVLACGRYLSACVPRRAYRAPEGIAEEALYRLTPRQRQILRLIGEAKESVQIATDLGITLRTLAFHRAQLRRVLGVQSALALVEYAVANRLAADS